MTVASGFCFSVALANVHRRGAAALAKSLSERWPPRSSSRRAIDRCDEQSKRRFLKPPTPNSAQTALQAWGTCLLWQAHKSGTFRALLCAVLKGDEVAWGWSFQIASADTS